MIYSIDRTYRSQHQFNTDYVLLRQFASSGQYSPIKMDYFHTISALYQFTLDFFKNVLGIILIQFGATIRRRLLQIFYTD